MFRILSRGLRPFPKSISKVEQALLLHGQRSEVYARMSTPSVESVAAKVIMNRVFTYDQQVADVVKNHGQFVFEGTPCHAAYVSTFHRNLGKSKARRPEAEADDTIKDAAV